MSDNKSIVNIDLKGLSKVGVALIEKVGDAIGGLSKPYQIVRTARAQAKADLITAEAEVEIDALKRRALERFVAEEAKKQSNIEEITQKAVPLLDAKSEPQNLNDDWVSNFFDKCRIVSDDDMQQLWSRLLAGEANAPGKFSKRTISLLADLDKSDAELFKRFCGYCWVFGEITPLIFEVEEAIYGKNFVNFNSVSHLESLGLVHFDNVFGYRRIGVPNNFVMSYYDRSLALEKQRGAGEDLQIGKARLTNAGKQLAEICGSTPVDGFYEYVIEQFKKNNYLAV